MRRTHDSAAPPRSPASRTCAAHPGELGAASASGGARRLASLADGRHDRVCSCPAATAAPERSASELNGGASGQKAEADKWRVNSRRPIALQGANDGGASTITVSRLEKAANYNRFDRVRARRSSMNRLLLTVLAMSLCALGCSDDAPKRCEVPWPIPWDDGRRLVTFTVSLRIDWTEFDSDCSGEEREVALVLDPVISMLREDGCEISIRASRCAAARGALGGNAGFASLSAGPSPPVDSYLCGDFYWTAPGTFEGDAQLTRVERSRPFGPPTCTATGHVVLTALQPGASTMDAP